MSENTEKRFADDLTSKIFETVSVVVGNLKKFAQAKRTEAQDFQSGEGVDNDMWQRSQGNIEAYENMEYAMEYVLCEIKRQMDNV